MSGEEFGLPELTEITEPQANDLIERFRERWSGEN